MKWFWVVVAVVVVGAGALMVMSRSRDAGADSGVAEPSADSEAAGHTPPSGATGAQPATLDPASAPASQEFATTVTVAMAPKDAPLRPELAARSAPSATSASPWGTTPPPALTGPSPAPAAPTTAAPSTDAAAGPSPTKTSNDAGTANAAVASASPARPDPASPAAPSATSPAPPQPAPPNAAATTRAANADGAKSPDDRFPVVGDGTKDNPYIVTWGWLVSASETYKPKLGQKVLPERVTMLDGKYVKITGYVAFPYMVQQATETLMMQNQWDGCCIGVPPTPFDAIEVTLRDPASPTTRLMQYGTVVGKLKVEPYLRGQWLISLYAMTDAALTPEM